ncbi:MAG: ATP-grasp domain-containing protein [Candidatus Melainabacteria bacterium]|jgi:biotin carboxylase|nr:ATP-grasp domain-containing protein [Candidatus Melainabacteria bacterium]
MKDLLILCPTARERRSLPVLAERIGVNLRFDDFGGDYFDDLLADNPDLNTPPLDIIKLMDEVVQNHYDDSLAGITSGVGYPGMSATAVLTERLGLPGPKPAPILLCEHKYYSRVEQAKIVPSAAPKFHLIDPKDLSSIDKISTYPGFLKPVKSCMSKNAFQIKDKSELRKHAEEALLPELFILPFNDLVHNFTDWELNANYLLYEELLEGKQVSLEGFVYKGEVTIMGIIDAIMFPNTFSFKRFQYPSRLPQDVLWRMEQIAAAFIRGIGYNNAMFNMELIYNPNSDTVHIIEVNPKIASQFPDLFEKVDGSNTYEVMMRIALGMDPGFIRRQGKFKIAASCVLRTFDDKLVKKIPDQENIKDVEMKFPGSMVQVIATQGKKLSEQLQDAHSFRYGLINMGADSEDELVRDFEKAADMLNYQLEPVH